MKKTKITALFLALVILSTALTGCNMFKKKDVVATVAGKNITTDMYKNALKQSSAYYQQMGLDMSQLLDQKVDGTKTGAELLKEEAMQSFILFSALDKLAKDNKISITKDDEKTLKANKDKQIESMGGRATFIKNLTDSGTTEEYFDYVNRYNFLYTKINDQLFKLGKPLAPKETDIVASVLKDYVRAKHVLIQTTADAKDFAAKKAKAQEILKQAKAGKDFDALVKEFNEDPGMKDEPDGYVFTKNKMAKEFETAAFKLKDNQISDLVQTSYGFHIIKRLPLTEDYIKKNIEKLSADFVTTALQNKLLELKKDISVVYTDTYKNLDIKTLLGIKPTTGTTAAPSTSGGTTAPSTTAPSTTAPSTSGGTTTPAK